MEFLRTDVSVSAQMKALITRAVEVYGRIDIIVNNAGISHPNRPMLEVDEAFFDRLYAVNVKSIYLSAIHCVPIFRRQGGGCFINIGSTAAVRPRPGLSWYSGSKGAVALLTKGMAVELAPDRIRVNAINPALGETPLLSTFLGGEDTPAARARFMGSIPLGRFCRPEDVANAAVFFAKNTAALATSSGRQKRPSGIDPMNRARAAGVSSPPRKVDSNGVSPSAGLMAFTRIRSGANSTAIPLVRSATAPFDPLYHDNPGRGRTAAVEPILMKQPPP